MSAWKSSIKNIPGNYVQHDLAVNFTDEQIGHTMGTPAANKYTSIDLEVYKRRASIWNIKDDKTLGCRLQKLPKLNNPSPSSY